MNLTLSADKTSYSLFGSLTEMGHEQVMFCQDKATGLRSIIAIHNTVLGPALGGTRFWNYEREEDALIDALRLSRGMTYKAAITGLHLGGGKAVIIGDPRKQKSEALFRRYGKFVNSLNGKYITAEDVGTSSRDMAWVARETKYVTGIPEYYGGGGDPSPYTAYGVYLGMKAAVKSAFGHDSLTGKRILVQGVGHVGSYLVDHLSKEDAHIAVSDIFEDRVKSISKKFNVTVVEPGNEYDYDMEIYAPCALGASVNDDTIDRLKCAVIAGAANNQLQDEDRHGRMLMEHGIAYAPDYVINAGGLINVAAEWEGYNSDRVKAQCEEIYSRTSEIFEFSAQSKIPTNEAANRMAEARLKSIASLNAVN